LLDRKDATCFCAACQPDPSGTDDNSDGTPLPTTFGVVNRTNAAGQVIAVNTIREFAIVSGTSTVQNPFAEVDFKTSGDTTVIGVTNVSSRRFSNGVVLNSQYTFARSFGNTAGSNEAADSRK